MLVTFKDTNQRVPSSTVPRDRIDSQWSIRRDDASIHEGSNQGDEAGGIASRIGNALARLDFLLLRLG